jgi:NADH-ubiquinone oxidoreductase chain 5
MRTILVNRLGDFFLFLGFSFFVFGFGVVCVRAFFFRFLLFFLLASFTKSAQFPFSGWLPKAMRAPTPARSLVHRSTLVTAGLFLIFNFKLIILQSFFGVLFIFFGLFTMVISNLLALYEKDVKKVVALSTMSQIGFCVFSFGLSFFFLTYFHVMSHAFFKRCLFMQLGFMIYYFFGQQDMRGYSFYYEVLLVVQFQFICCLLSLCGMFFIGGMLRKDFVVEIVFLSGGGFFYFLFFLLVV